MIEHGGRFGFGVLGILGQLSITLVDFEFIRNGTNARIIGFKIAK